MCVLQYLYLWSNNFPHKANAALRRRLENELIYLYSIIISPEIINNKTLYTNHSEQNRLCEEHMQVRGSQDQRGTYSNISTSAKYKKHQTNIHPVTNHMVLQRAGRKEVRNSQDTEIHKLIMWFLLVTVALEYFR